MAVANRNITRAFAWKKTKGNFSEDDVLVDNRNKFLLDRIIRRCYRHSSRVDTYRLRVRPRVGFRIPLRIYLHSVAFRPVFGPSSLISNWNWGQAVEHWRPVQDTALTKVACLPASYRHHASWQKLCSSTHFRTFLRVGLTKFTTRRGASQ
jgi:hypothetical protein